MLVGLPNESPIRAYQTALLPFPQLPLGARQSKVFSALGNRNLISIGQLCEHSFYAIITAKDVTLIGLNTTLTGTRNTDNGLYYIDLQSKEISPVVHIPHYSPFLNNVHILSTKSYIVKYLH